MTEAYGFFDSPISRMRCGVMGYYFGGVNGIGENVHHVTSKRLRAVVALCHG
jgi:hypothetical protein